MTKKLLIMTLTVFAILFSSSYIFATTNLGNTVRSSVNQSMNTVHNAGNAVTNATRTTVNHTGNALHNANAGGALHNGTSGLHNGVTGTTTHNANPVTPARTATAPYTAARTNANLPNNHWMGMSPTTWTWIILGIAAVVICSLVWYYGSRYETRNTED